MKARYTIKTLLAAAMLFAASNVWAVSVTVPNINPGAYGSDLAGSGLFLSSGLFTAGDDLTFNAEIFDLADGFGGGYEFGFFFADDPGTLIPIFDPADSTAFLGGQSALVDFGGGAVADIDDGLSLQSTFTPSSQPFGFYLAVGFATYYSDSTVPAQAGEDNVAEFPSLFTPGDFLIGIADDFGQGVQPLGYYQVTGIAPVPVPAAVWLFGTAMIGLFGLRRAKSRA